MLRLSTALLAVFCLLLAACGGEVASPDASGQDVPPTSEDPEGSPDTPSGGESLTIGISNLNTNLDSQIACDIVSWSSLRMVNDQLVYIDPTDLEVKPWLAESWEQEDDVTYVFSLREGVEFHNGEPFNAEAVVYSLLRFREPDACLRTTFVDLIADAEAVDDYTVRVTLNEPNWTALRLLQYVDILPPEAGEAEDFGTQPIGTGPYEVVNWVPNDRLELTRNEDYWAYEPEYEQVTWRILKEESTRVSALQAGEVDLINAIPVEQIEALEGAGLEVNIQETVRPMSIGVLMAKDSPFSQDARVRQAMNYAIDREGIINSLLGGHAVVMDSEVMHSAVPYAATFEPYVYDPDRARELLVEAGYPDGIDDCVMGGPVGRYIRDEEVGEAVAGQLRDVGIDCELRQQEIGGFLAEARAGAESEYDITLQSQSPGAFGTDFALGILYTNSPYSQWENSELEGIWREARAEPDESRRAELYEEAQRIAFEESVYVHLYFSPYIDAMEPGVPYAPGQDEFMVLEGRYRIDR